jgi:hypothetical protein
MQVIPGGNGARDMLEVTVGVLMVAPLLLLAGWLLFRPRGSLFPAVRPEAAPKIVDRGPGPPTPTATARHPGSESQAMSRSDYLWVGLNLIGVYLVVTGCVAAASGLYTAATASTRAGGFSTGLYEEMAQHEMARGGMSALGGVLLLVGAWVIGRPRDGGPEADYADTSVGTPPDAGGPPTDIPTDSIEGSRHE